jgi:hypothetical protein
MDAGQEETELTNVAILTERILQASGIGGPGEVADKQLAAARVVVRGHAG